MSKNNDKESRYNFYGSNMTFDLVGGDDTLKKDPNFYYDFKNSKIERTLLNNEKFSQELSKHQLSRSFNL